MKAGELVALLERLPADEHVVIAARTEMIEEEYAGTIPNRDVMRFDVSHLVSTLRVANDAAGFVVVEPRHDLWLQP